MTKVSEPFVKFDCAGCGIEVVRQISAKHARSEIDALRDGPPLLCAACAREAVVAQIAETVRGHRER